MAAGDLVDGVPHQADWAVDPPGDHVRGDRVVGVGRGDQDGAVDGGVRHHPERAAMPSGSGSAGPGRRRRSTGAAAHSGRGRGRRGAGHDDAPNRSRGRSAGLGRRAGVDPGPGSAPCLCRAPEHREGEVGEEEHGQRAIRKFSMTAQLKIARVSRMPTKAAPTDFVGGCDGLVCTVMSFPCSVVPNARPRRRPPPPPWWTPIPMVDSDLCHGSAVCGTSRPGLVHR